MNSLLRHPKARRRLVHTLVWGILIFSIWGGLWYVVSRARLASASLLFLRYRNFIMSEEYALARGQMTPARQALYSEEEQRRFYKSLREKHGALTITPPLRITKERPLRIEVVASFADGYTASVFYDLEKTQVQGRYLVNDSQGPEPGPW